MRTRSKTWHTKGQTGGGSYQLYDQGQPSGPPVSITNGQIAFPHGSENMSDELSLSSDGMTRQKEKRREAQLRRQLALLSRADGNVEIGTQHIQKALQIHRCVHTKSIISDFDDMVLKSRRTISGDKYRLYTYVHRNGSFMLRSNLLGSDPLNSGRWNSVNYTADAYRTPDWFALLDSFHEATNSLIPSSTLLGESMYENAIFVDAFKILINPSSAVKVLIPRLKKVWKRGMTLGGLRRTTKDGANAYLGYQFGVRPAIEEVRRALSAHSIVQGRLNWLSQNAGNFVPIRVRTTLSSTIENEDKPSSGLAEVKILCDKKDTIATISAWLKVREDLNYAAQWSAYVQYFGLQKAAGLLWELVPLSFVIDWFTDAQEYINRYLSPPVTNPFYNMRSLSHSLKQELSESVWVGSGYYKAEDQSTVEEPSSAFRICTRRTTSYTRSPSLPETSGFVDFSNLGLFHYITLGTMLLQKKL